MPGRPGAHRRLDHPDPADPPGQRVTTTAIRGAGAPTRRSRCSATSTIVVPVENGRPTGAPAAGASAPARGRRGRGLIALTLILAAAIGIGTAAWYYGIHRYTATPSLVNMAPAAAASEAEKVGLRTTLANQDFSEDVPNGDVMGDRPRRRRTGIRKNGEIGLTVSKGPERYRVPQLAGLELRGGQGGAGLRSS